MSRLSILFLGALVIAAVIRVLQLVGVVDGGPYSTAIVVGVAFVGMLAAFFIADYVERHRRTLHPRQ